MSSRFEDFDAIKTCTPADFQTVPLTAGATTKGKGKTSSLVSGYNPRLHAHNHQTRTYHTASSIGQRVRTSTVRAVTPHPHQSTADPW
eukprot:1194835-Prorocentrum_minimum.AAC.7